MSAHSYHPFADYLCAVDLLVLLLLLHFVLGQAAEASSCCLSKTNDSCYSRFHDVII
jgi:hypothetical protein